MVFTVYGTASTNTSGIYGTVASIFLFQGAYAVGITPITVLYPSEILNFSIRANGMALWVVVVEATGYFLLHPLHVFNIRNANKIPAFL